MLILGLGSGTKRLPGFLNCRKTYETVVLFGAATDSFDRLGRVVEREREREREREGKREREKGDDGKETGKEDEKEKGKLYAHITREKVLAALDKFRGRIWQVPPIYSAKWMNGKRLYDYAREGLPLPEEIKGKEVVVEELEMVEWLEPGMHGYHIPTEGVGGVAEGKNSEGEVDGPRSGGAEDVKSLKRVRSTIDNDDVADTSSSATEAPPNTTAPPAKKTKTNAQEEKSTTDSPGEPINNNTNNTQPIINETADINNSQPATANNTNSSTPPSSQSHSTAPQPPAAKLRMTVSSGFYVRSLCHDLGIAVGSYGLMAELVRTQQAEFRLERGLEKNDMESIKGKGKDKGNVLEYDDLAKGEEVWGPKVVELIKAWDADGGNKVEIIGKAEGRGIGGGHGGNVRKQRRQQQQQPQQQQEEKKGGRGSMEGDDRRNRSKYRSRSRSRRNTSSPE